LNREQAYRLALSEKAQLQQQQADCEIACEFPCAAMAKLGWIERSTTPLGKYRELLCFFGTAKLSSLTKTVDLAPKFRRKQGEGACQRSLAAWLRKGLLEAQRIETAEFDQQRMEQSLDVSFSIQRKRRGWMTSQKIRKFTNWRPTSLQQRP